MEWLMPARGMERAAYRLTRSFDSVLSRDHATRVVVIRGGPGSGKSTTLQALYEYAARQQDREYWPRFLGQSGGAPLPGLLAPDEFTVPPGTGLPWIWLGLSGRDPSIIESAQLQWMQHARALLEAIHRIDDAPAERWRYARDLAFLVGKYIPVVGQGIDFLGDMGDLGDLLNRGPALFASRRRRLDQALKVDHSRRFSTREAAAGELAESAEAMGRLAGLVPLIVALDDAEDAPSDLFETLERVIKVPGSRVLLALTLDSDRIAVDSACHRFLQGTEVFVPTSEVAGRFTDQELAKLCMARMQESFGEGISDAGALGAVVTAADGVPGRLIGAISRRSIREALAGHSALPPIQPAWLRAPGPEAAWSALQNTARTALALVACHGPETMASWISSENVEVARATGWTETVESGGYGIVRFRSISLFTAASAAKKEQLSTLEIETQSAIVRKELTQRAETQDWSDIPSLTGMALLQNLADTELDISDRLRAALLRMRRASGRETAGEDLLNLLRHRHPRGELLLATVEALTDAGYARTAIDAYEGELARLSDRYGPDAPQTLPPMHNLAGAWGAYALSRTQADSEADWEHTFGLFNRVIQGYERDAQTRQVFPARLLPDTRVELARLYHRVGRYLEAYDTLLPAINIYEALLGADDRAVLAARGDLARYHGKAGDLRAAVKEHRLLLHDKRRALGESDIATLTTWGNLAAFLGEAGDWPDAVAELEALLPKLEFSQGPYYEGVLATRSNIARNRGMMEDWKGQVAALEALLPDLLRTKARDDPNTIVCRLNLANARGKAGDRRQAIEELEKVLVDSIRVQGADHPTTQTIRERLSQFRGDEERPNRS
ncbi:tetratricopeptide repeat protein [Micromonospora sp. DT81.3]|uniref:tetratricopeptide repeat protein n=1 Tax=Micromonospora sp. DT81.3 TaxID=3416523 RepID=UPI003CF1BAA0